ncbi:hypothetical protein NL676_001498 [Syzygium grande]|nr:hypothetical protein NL676_001498 [Syzygium grande]
MRRRELNYRTKSVEGGDESVLSHVVLQSCKRATTDVTVTSAEIREREGRQWRGQHEDDIGSVEKMMRPSLGGGDGTCDGPGGGGGGGGTAGLWRDKRVGAGAEG